MNRLKSRLKSRVSHLTDRLAASAALLALPFVLSMAMLTKEGDSGAATVTLTYSQAKNRLKDINDELERLDAKADKTETRTLGDEDQKYWDDLIVEARNVNAFIQQKERESQRQELKRMGVARAAGVPGGAVRGSDDMDTDPLGEPDSVEEHRFKNPWDTGEIRMGLSPSARGVELRARALSAIEKMQGTTDNRRAASTKMVERWDTEDGQLSQIVLATSSPEYLRAFTKLAKTYGRAEVLNAEERAAVERAMSLTDAAGGYLVPFQLDPSVILTSDGSYNEIRQIARKVVATTDVWNGVSAGAVSWSFDAEASEVSDDTPTFAGPAITIRTARGFVPISLEASMDAQNVAQEVGTLLAQGKDDLEATVFATGLAASNQPVGLISALATGSPVVIVTSTTTDTFAIGDLYKVYGALPARYRSRASWLANNLIYSLTRQFDTQGGAGLWTTLQNDRPQQLIGRPVYESEAMDGTITALAENYVAVFGDFSNYVIADRVGMTVEFVPQLFGSNGRPTGQRGWFAHYRVGADVVNRGGFRVLNVT
jgi:HK97 family phage major capsid protein